MLFDKLTYTSRRAELREKVGSGLIILLGNNNAPCNYPANGYMGKIPTDPWGNPYVYVSPGQKTPFEIMSLGADGLEGGEGENADIVDEDRPAN